MTTTTSATNRYELLSFSVTNDLHGSCCLDARVRVGAEVRDTRGSGSSSTGALIDALRQIAIDIDGRGAALRPTETSGRGGREGGDSEIDRLCAVIAACNRQERESSRPAALELAGV